MSRLTLKALSALLCCAWASVSLAEPSEVMLLIDASSSMQFIPSADRLPSGCSFPRGGAPAGPISAEDQEAETVGSETRFHLVQSVLAAEVDGPPVCLGHSADERARDYLVGEDGAFPHFRRMCRSATNRIIPCGRDHGRRRGAIDPDGFGNETPANLVRSGFLTDDTGSTYHDISFGLMVSDSNPLHATRNRDSVKDWSFGDESLAIPRPAPPSLPPGQANRSALNVAASNASVAAGFNSGISSAARAPWLGSDPDESYLEQLGADQINLGAMGEDAPAGRLITPLKGTIDSPTLSLDGNPQRIQAHNDWVRDELQRIIPTGPTPLSALLDDLRRYYEDQRRGSCATRVAVLVTDGAESSYLPMQRCQNNRDCRIGDQQGTCVQTRHSELIHHERVVENSGACAQRSCAKVCAFPDGAPYPSSIESARTLYHQLGVPVIVATVGLPDAKLYVDRLSEMPPALLHAYQIAEAGSPGLGPREGMPGIYSITDLRSDFKAHDLVQRLQSPQSQGLKVETQPLVMGVADSDAPWRAEPDSDLRQWRLSNSALSPSGDQRSYGEIEANRLGCRGAGENSVGLKAMGQLFYEQTVVDQATRPVFTPDLGSSRARGVIDSAQALFRSNGEVIGEDYKAYLTHRSVTSTSARPIGLQIGGYFGERGRAGLTPLKRSVGANLNGDIVALPPRPSEERPAKEAAPTLVIHGGDDGLLHVFRAFDGWELFGFVPMSSWAAWSERLEAKSVHVDAPLNAAHLSECRLVDGGGRCVGAASADFRPVVVGSAGFTSREYYGFEIAFTPEQLRQAEPNLRTWPQGSAWSLSPSTRGAEKLGKAVSRPALTHVRIDGKTRAVAVVGCGDDPSQPFVPLPNQTGRCVLFIDAFSGEVLHTLKGTDLARFTFPVSGSPSVFPGGDVAAEMIYIGDRMGQLWRIDLEGDDPDDWPLTRVWPVNLIEQVPEELTRGLGFGISERPSLAYAPNNDLIVLFGTSGSRVGSIPPGVDEAARGYMVSLRERKTVDEQGRVQRRSSVNWVLDYAPDETMTGAPKVKDGVVYFSTSRPSSAEVCGQAAGQEGRLYGVHYTKYLQQSYQDTAGNRSLNVVPMLPRYTPDGARADNALSLILPPGRTAHGFAVVPTPSCSLDAATITELVLNLSDEGGGANLQLNGLQVEYVRGMGSQPGAPAANPVNGVMALEKAPLDQSLQVKMSGKVMNVALTPPNGAPPQSVIFNPASPFPSKVLYWGGAYGQ